MNVPLREGTPQTRRIDEGTQSLRFRLTHDADVGDVRRTVRSYALRCGLGEQDAERLAIVITECGNNILRHAGDGSIIFSRTATATLGFEVLAIDSGPGIEDMSRALEDGYSTAGTVGCGLGSIRRQSDLFDAHSEPGEGTAILSRIYKDRQLDQGPLSRISAICLPRSGETLSGDAWSAGNGSEVRIVLADGLGHGPAAAEASTMAVETFRTTGGTPPETLQLIHDALRSTRGAAVSVVEISRDGAVEYCGIGNVRAVLSSIDQSRELVSMNGTAGHRARRIQPFHYEGADESILIMHSDGLRSKWKLEQFRSLRVREPGIIAAVLLRECERRTDDVCVVVCKGGAA